MLTLVVGVGGVVDVMVANTVGIGSGIQVFSRGQGRRKNSVEEEMTTD